uniref:ferritin family protein n=1 Tax=Ruminiclostridium cellobioparum TaxID=29355 RepID=UPI0028AF1B20
QMPQQNSNLMGMPNMTSPVTQQKPNQQAMPNMTAQMPQQSSNIKGMPNMTSPVTQQKPNQQAMSNKKGQMEPMPKMTLPTVPAPKDNSMFAVSMKGIKPGQQKSNMMNQNMNNTMGQHMGNANTMGQHTGNANVMGQHMGNANTMGQHMGNANTMGQHMGNANVMGQHMENANVMGQQMENSNLMGQSLKGNELSDTADIQVSLVEALSLIKDAVEGETEDRMFYDFLINNAASRKDKEIIKGIRDDEIKHARLFRQLYYEHTGKVIGPKQNVQFERPASYCEGLIKALMGEQNAVRKYRRILFAMKERSHIDILTEIITDEIRHANLYNLLIHNNDCKY